MTDLNKLLDGIKKVILNSKEFDEKEILSNIDYCIKYFNGVKNSYISSLNSSNEGIFFEQDFFLEGNDITSLIKKTLEAIKDRYGDYVIDEVAVLKYDGIKYFPVYFYSNNPQRGNLENKGLIREKLETDLQFYTGNLLKDELLEDGEGTLAGNQSGTSFDIVLRIGDYIFGFNNSNLSIDEIQGKYDINKVELIKQVSELYNFLK